MYHPKFIPRIKSLRSMYLIKFLKSPSFFIIVEFWKLLLLFIFWLLFWLGKNRNFIYYYYFDFLFDFLAIFFYFLFPENFFLYSWSKKKRKPEYLAIPSSFYSIWDQRFQKLQEVWAKVWRWKIQTQAVYIIIQKIWSLWFNICTIVICYECFR